MLPLALGALSSGLDALQALGSAASSSSSSSRNAGGSKFDPFDLFGSRSSRDRSSDTSPLGNGPQISPQTMRALLAAQNQSQSAQSQTATSSRADKWDPLQNLFSMIDGDGNGSITKQEFENALGAGGTNLGKADEVFGKLDANNDGIATLDEMASALKGGRGHHHHHHAQSAGDAGSNDPLAQALSGATSSQTANSDGSTTTTLTFADGSKVTMTSAPKSSSSATSSYNFIERLIENQAQALASKSSPAVAVSA